MSTPSTGKPGRPASHRRTRLLAGLLISVVLAFIVSGLGKLDVDTGVAEFVPADDPATKALDEVASSFGGDPIVLLVESGKPGELLAQDRIARLLALEGKLSRLPDVASVYGPATVLNQIAGQAQDFLAELTGYRDGLRARAERRARGQGASPEQVQQAVREATAAFDRRYGSLLAEGIPGGLPTLRNERFIRTAVFSRGFEPRPQWHFVVPAPNAVAVLIRPRQYLGQAANEQLVTSVRNAVDRAGLEAERVTVSGAPAVVGALGAQVRHEIPLLGGVALLAVSAWFLLMRWTRLRYRLLPLATAGVATSVTFALFGWLGVPISLGAVAFLPILLGVGSDFMTYLHRRVGRRVVASVAAATAASFAALAATPIPAVRELGMTLALGILIACGAAWVVVRWHRPSSGEYAPNEIPRAAGGVRTVPRRVRVGAGAVVAALAVLGWVLLPALPLKADFESFAADLPALSDVRHVEDVLGSSGEIVVALTGKDVVTRGSLEWMRNAENEIVAAYGDRVRPTLSPPSLLRFLGASPTPDQLESALRLTPRYLTGSVIRGDQGMAVLSFGVRLNNAEELRELRDNIQRLLPPPPEGVGVRMTGLPFVAVAAHEAVSESRYLANMLGIAAAGAVLLVFLRRRGDAALAVAAAGMATGLGLLGMWLGDIPLTPITVAVGSLTAAVGCEFTVVLADAARRRDTGVRTAVILAAAASATGYAVLVASELALVRQFGAVLAGTVALALGSAALVVWLATPTLLRRAADDSSPVPAADTRWERTDARQPV